MRAGHLRRYRSRGLREVVESAGFAVTEQRGYQFVLLPAIAANRVASRWGPGVVDREETPPGWARTACSRRSTPGRRGSPGGGGPARRRDRPSCSWHDARGSHDLRAPALPHERLGARRAGRRHRPELPAGRGRRRLGATRQGATPGPGPHDDRPCPEPQPRRPRGARPRTTAPATGAGDLPRRRTDRPRRRRRRTRRRRRRGPAADGATPRTRSTASSSGPQDGSASASCWRPGTRSTGWTSWWTPPQPRLPRPGRPGPGPRHALDLLRLHGRRRRPRRGARGGTHRVRGRRP